MSGLEITSFITLLANAISCDISDNDILAFLGTLFTQLGDTLSTISSQRDLCDKLVANNIEPQD